MAQTVPQAVLALRQGGRLVTADAHGGGTVPLDLRRLYLRQLTLIGAPVESTAAYATSLQAMAEGWMRVMIDTVLPLAGAAEAHRRVEAGETLGKIVLDPTGSVRADAPLVRREQVGAGDASPAQTS